jgi:hypothetical protein
MQVRPFAVIKVIATVRRRCSIPLASHRVLSQPRLLHPEEAVQKGAPIWRHTVDPEKLQEQRVGEFEWRWATAKNADHKGFRMKSYSVALKVETKWITFAWSHWPTNEGKLFMRDS